MRFRYVRLYDTDKPNIAGHFAERKRSTVRSLDGERYKDGIGVAGVTAYSTLPQYPVL